VQGSYTSIIISALDQFQLVPSGGDTGPHSWLSERRLVVRESISAHD
jgi:hypothetical protein